MLNKYFILKQKQIHKYPACLLQWLPAITWAGADPFKNGLLGFPHLSPWGQSWEPALPALFPAWPLST